MTIDLRQQLSQEGYALPAGKIDAVLLADLDHTLNANPSQAGRRDLLSEQPLTRRLLTDPFLVDLTQQVFDQPAFVVRATLFDKRPEANWSVTWHQDQAIAVNQRQDVEGFGPWSEKNGVHHVEPPLEILEAMVAIRIHLEDCTDDHGPLVVSPQTHRLGRITGDQIQPTIQQYGQTVCPVAAGSALVMKPLALHRSSKMSLGKRRRVIHFDCTDQPLPHPLQWNYNARFDKNS